MHARGALLVAGFTEWRVEQNALLSDEAKCLMYRLWAPGRGTGAWTDEALAHAFKIRVQRALAIVKIKELEFQAVCIFSHCFT
jgi:hypothetical protein